MYNCLLTLISVATLQYDSNKSFVKQINDLSSVEPEINFLILFDIP